MVMTLMPRCWPDEASGGRHMECRTDRQGKSQGKNAQFPHRAHHAVEWCGRRNGLPFPSGSRGGKAGAAQIGSKSTPLRVLRQLADWKGAQLSFEKKLNFFSVVVPPLSAATQAATSYRAATRVVTHRRGARAGTHIHTRRLGRKQIAGSLKVPPWGWRLCRTTTSAQIVFGF